MTLPSIYGGSGQDVDTRAQLARAGEADMGTHGEIAGLAAELAEVMRRQERQTVLHTADVEQRDQ